jgi:hypothetical protein
MSAIPLETVTLLGSSILGTVSKLVAIAMSAAHEREIMKLQAMSAGAKIVDQARRYANPHFQWTRRVIALMAVFSIIVLPKLAAIYVPWIDISYGYQQATKSLFGLGGTTQLLWQTVHGLTITPLDTHMLAAIIGLYFGGSLARE